MGAAFGEVLRMVVITAARAAMTCDERSKNAEVILETCKRHGPAKRERWAQPQDCM